MDWDASGSIGQAWTTQRLVFITRTWSSRAERKDQLPLKEVKANKDANNRYKMKKDREKNRREKGRWKEVSQLCRRFLVKDSTKSIHERPNCNRESTISGELRKEKGTNTCKYLVIKRP